MFTFFANISPWKFIRGNCGTSAAAPFVPTPIDQYLSTKTARRDRPTGGAIMIITIVVIIIIIIIVIVIVYDCLFILIATIHIISCYY